MHSKNSFIIFVGVIFCFLCLHPIEAQDDTGKAIKSLIAVSQQIDQDNELDPKKVVAEAWSNVPVAAKSDPDVLYCYSLIRLNNDLPTYQLLTRISSIAPDDFRLKKAHIYSAFKEIGAITGCKILTRYMVQGLEKANQDAQEFLFWAFPVIETLSDEDPVKSLTKTFRISDRYTKFRNENNDNIEAFNQRLMAQKQKLNFDDSKAIDKQIDNAKDDFHKLIARFEQGRSNIQLQITTVWNRAGGTLWLRRIFRCVPVDFKGNVIPVNDQVYRNLTLDPYWCVQIIGPYIVVREFSSGRLYGLGRLENAPLFQGDSPTRTPNYYELARWRNDCQQRQLLLQELIRLNTIGSNYVQQFSSQMANLTDKYSVAIANDAELRLTISNFQRQFLAFRQEYAKQLIIDKKKLVVENRTLRILGKKLAPLLNFSITEEIAAMQLM